ncbi:polysaccharide pyruvyl transferase family protein [Candidatus Peregrinibacteria bacterium]|nr:polysaccharide pyruvyl transferase family protein [Candidatus Peregrinibacteria bacterium]
MSQTFTILCGNAAFNRGDRANLASQIALLKSEFPGCRIIVGSYRAQIDREWYDAEVIPRGKIFSRALFRAIKESDAVIFGGGALLADNAGRLLIPYWLCIIAFVRFILKKPVMAWAHGIVLETKLGKFLARILLNITESVTVRDHDSLDQLRALKLKVRPHLTADPAILIEPSSPHVGEKLLQEQAVTKDRRPLFAIAPTFWHLYHRPGDLLPYQWARSLGLRRDRSEKEFKEYTEALAHLCDRLIARFHCRILFLPRYPAAPWKEEERLALVRTTSLSPEDITVFKGDDHPPRDYFSMWHHFDCLISVALHDAIIATALKIPCVHISYEPKGRSFFERISALDRIISYERFLKPEGPEAVTELTVRTLERWPKLLPYLDRSVEALQEAAQANALHLKRMMERVGYTEKASMEAARLQTSVAS